MSKHLGEWEMTHLDLLEKLQEIRVAGDWKRECELLSLFADCEVFEFTNEQEVRDNTKLEEYERDFVLNWLRKGASKVWLATDFVPWEH